MNIRIILILLILVISCSAIAQKNPVVTVQLKNGYSVKGTIVEQNINNIIIRTLNGEQVEYPTDQVESILDSNQKSKESKKENSKSEIINTVFLKGDHVVNLGFAAGQDWYQYYDKTTFPRILFAYENCIKENLFDNRSFLGIGGFVGGTATKSSFVDAKQSFLTIGARSSVHYLFVNKLDSYAGVLIGTRIIKESSVNYSYSDNELALSINIGARYYLIEQGAVYVELGLGTFNYSSLGISFRF